MNNFSRKNARKYNLFCWVMVIWTSFVLFLLIYFNIPEKEITNFVEPESERKETKTKFDCMAHGSLISFFLLIFRARDWFWYGRSRKGSN